MPPFKSFDPYSKKTEEFKEIQTWYNNEAQKLLEDPESVYDMEAELYKYCSMDVTVLRLAMERFRETMMGLFQGIDPFIKITLPSYCNHVYRTLYMPENSIAVLPPKGFTGRSSQSSSALAWMDWFELVHFDGKPLIRTASNGGEVRFGPYFLDGYLEIDGVRYAWEFFGCYYHGHIGCQNPGKVNTRAGKTMLELYRETMDKLDYLEENGLIVFHKWECQFRQEKKSDLALRELASHRASAGKPLIPRDALRGGRTNANWLYYKKKPGETIHFYDYTSLYPSCQMSTAGQVWPMGHPTVYVNNFPDVHSFLGLIKAEVLPPKRLYFPILPCLVDSKVLFGLCMQCLQDRSQKFCTHNDMQRTLSGTFVSAEFQEALKMGYSCVKIHEMWCWDENQRTQDGLFGDFMREAYREKVEAAGYPANVDTDEAQEQYRNFYKEAQGVVLRPDKVERNPSRKQVGKSTITSLWGFFCKQDNPLTTKYVRDFAELCRLASDETIHIDETYNPYGDQIVFRYKQANGHEKPDPKANVALGAFTTCMGRLRLNEILQKLKERVLYFDTDSAVWVSREGEEGLSTGPLMGDLTDEILEKYGPNAEISEFACSGPKCYMCVITDIRTGELLDVILKVKGVRLCVGTEKWLNPDAIRNAVFHGTKYRVPCSQIRKDLKTGSIWSVELEKMFQKTYDKRLIMKNYSTLPFGWVYETGDPELLV